MSEKIHENSMRLEGLIKDLESKVDDIDMNLILLKQQISIAKNPNEQQKLKKKAFQLLQQKKIYEKQKDSYVKQSMNLSQAVFMNETMKNNMETYKVMKETSKNIQQQVKQVNAEKVDRLQDDIFDMQKDFEELNEAMTRNYDVPTGIEGMTDEDLLEEFNAIENSTVANKMDSSSANVDSSYLDEIELPSKVKVPMKR